MNLMFVLFVKIRVWNIMVLYCTIFRLYLNLFFFFSPLDFVTSVDRCQTERCIFLVK